MTFRFACIVLLLIPLSADTVGKTIVLHNATIYTMAISTPYASALCFEGDRIVDIGNEERVLGGECAKASDRIVNLQGAIVVPGLTDSHAHLMMEAARRTRADLTNLHSAEQAAKAAVAFAKSHPQLVNASGGWVQGFGWDQTQWPGGAFPNRQILDALFPETPVFLEQLSGHACWVNSRALAIAADEIPAKGDPPGGHIERDASGHPTGVFSDNAVRLIEKHIPPLTGIEANAALSDVLKDCASNGLTGVHDLDAQDADIKLFQRRHDQGTLTLRVYAMRDGATGSPEMPHVTSNDGLLTVRGVKFFSDGAMGSWSAAMLAPYSDKPNVSGTLVYASDALLGNVSAWAAKGYQIATHAIGDAGNRQVLDVYAKLLAPRRGQDLRWRIEHAQILSSNDVPRFGELQVIPSMQPSHCASDLPYALQRLGFSRASRSYAWNSLLKTGIAALPFGSDFPTAGTIPPLLGFHAAVTRETAEGIPLGGWFPEQRVTRYQALKGYTRDAAFASFREKELGAILPGFFADLTVLNHDLLTVDAQQILNVSVLATIVGGRVVYNNYPPLASLVLQQGDPSQARPSVRDFENFEMSKLWRRYVRDMSTDHGGDIAPFPIPRATEPTLLV